MAVIAIGLLAKVDWFFYVKLKLLFSNPILKKVSKMKRSKTQKVFGFTLIELMIVVVIIGVLAAIGYPSYRQYVYKSRRADAKAILLQMQLAEEKWRANNSTYTNALANLLPASNLIAGTYYSNDRYYTLGVSNVAGTTYTLTATYTGAQTGDTACKTLSIDQAGVKTATNSADAASTICW